MAAADVYYNENDPFAAQWLRNLIAAGHIAPGDVDERSIADVGAGDLIGYRQCHFFAGIGGWSYALRLAGWPDVRPVWTGSCPCQPFSSAGAGQAADDERHLWPQWFSLIAECRPPIVFGEQVEAAIGWGWLDLVLADLEAEGYACGATVLPACGVGAPHIRQRVWFVADAGHVQWPSWPERRIDQSGASIGEKRGGGSSPSGLAVSEAERPVRHSPGGWQAERRVELDGRLGNAAGEQMGRAGQSWGDGVWLPCTDGKARRVEPGTFPLAHGIPGRVGRLRAYGNAIVPYVAAAFIGAYMDCRP